MERKAKGRRIESTNKILYCHDNGTDAEHEDRLSALPESLLVDILNLLPIETAATTSVLSSRWQHLWTQVTHLVFNKRNFPPSVPHPDYSGSFFTVINHILLQQLTSRKIQRFVISLPHVWKAEFRHCTSSIESWLRHICYRNAEHIEVRYTSCVFSPTSCIPVSTFVLQCPSLRSLILVGDLCFKLLPDSGKMVSTCLPNLKILHLEIADLDTNLLAAIFNSCPLLKYVFLRGEFSDSGCCLDLSSHKLKSLSIINISAIPLRVNFLINVSKLQYLTLHFLCLPCYHFVENEKSGLLEANIRLQSELLVGDDYRGLTMALAQTITSIRLLCLNGTTLKAFSDLGSFSNFDNLTRLKIKLDYPSGCWNDVLLLLDHCPNLEVLDVPLAQDREQVIGWAKPDSVPRCLNRINRVRLANLRGNSVDFKMIKFILDKSNALQQLSITAGILATRKGAQLWKEYEFCEALFHLPRKSSICQINFSGSFISSSSKCLSNGILACLISRSRKC